MNITPMVLFEMSPFMIASIIICVVLIAAIIFLTIWGKKQQKKMDESQAQIEAAAQQLTILVIDKKKLRFKHANLPQVVVDATPWYAKGAKVPIVKAKVGPKVMTLIADNDIFDMIPVKQEIKATISGIYITKVRSLRGPALVKPAKKSFSQKIRAKAKELSGSESTTTKKKK